MRGRRMKLSDVAKDAGPMSTAGPFVVLSTGDWRVPLRSRIDDLLFIESQRVA